MGLGTPGENRDNRDEFITLKEDCDMVECLIDHQRVWITLISCSQSQDLDVMVSLHIQHNKTEGCRSRCFD